MHINNILQKYTECDINNLLVRLLVYKRQRKETVLPIT